MDYGNWNLKELKAELRKRSARISGKKAQLVERLEAYDRNKDFNKKDEVSVAYEMKTPDKVLYKDINGDVSFPVITGQTLESYLKNMDKTMDKKAKNLYDEQFLLFVRFAKDTNFLLHAQCAAEMRKNVTYKTDISIDENGVILECQCECGAGMGPSAHCKHVCAVIFGLIDFSTRRIINVRIYLFLLQ